MRKLIAVTLFLSLYSCDKDVSTLKEGAWRATLEVQDNQELPFLLNVTTANTLIVSNGEERILVDEIKIYGDSIRIQTPVYEGFFKGVFVNESLIEGEFIKPSLDRVVPFKMVYGQASRFRESKKNPLTSITGNWETVFSDNTPDRYIAKGIFEQDGSKVTGTFRTTTGDYRYLEGVLEGDELRLSTFDGAHAFLFTAKVSDSSMNGYFYSGNHWKEPFTARRNDTYTLPDAKDLTFIKEGYDGLDFSFPVQSGKKISIKDNRYRDKVVLVQIMGSWCPNCLEESKYYVNYLKEHPNADLEVIGLAFEYAPTEEKAFKSIARLKDRLEITYPIALAQYGTENKKLANAKLPMLNHVLSYPTTIFIDKKGSVRRIHTGFNGAATGEKYLEYKKDFEDFVQTLLDEEH